MGEPTVPASRPAVLVTGAGGAIGTALLRRFAAVGAWTAGTDLAADPPAAVAPHVALWASGDVTVPEDMDRVVADVVAARGGLDVVVVNAGVTALGRFEDISDDAFRRVLDVNVLGAVHTVRAALAPLRESRGRIVVLSSVAGFAPVVGRAPYTASKHAVTGLCESLRYELRDHGIGVTVVYPTFLATSPTDVNRTGADPAPRQVAGRLLDADDVARAIVRAVRRGQDRVYPGTVAKLARVLSRLTPRLYGELMVRRLGSGP